MKTPFHIEIPKRNASCCHQGEKFVSGMDYFSLLLEDESKKIKRLDYCAACWKKDIFPHQDLTFSRGYWKSRIDLKDKPAPTTRAEKAVHLLKRLLAENPAPENDIFVLVLLLLHMRRLVLRKEFEEENSRFGLYELPQTEEFLKIKQIHLSSLEIEKIQQSLASQLALVPNAS